MSKLVTSEGEILVPGIKELVAPLTDEERKRYDLINFTVKVGANPCTARMVLIDNRTLMMPSARLLRFQMTRLLP